MVIARDDWGQAGEGEAAGLKRGGEWGGRTLEEYWRRRRRRRRRQGGGKKRDEATVARHTVEVGTIFCLTL